MSDTMTVRDHSRMTVRDHSQPCEHVGVDAVKVFDIGGVWFHDGQNVCPGGKEIILRVVPNTGRKLLDGTTVPYWMVETTDE